MEPYWDQIKEIVRESDVVLEILDARAVELSRNEQLEQIIKEAGRPRIYIINKADLVSRKELEKAVTELVMKREVNRDDIMYFSNRIRTTITNLMMKIKKTFEKYGKRSGFSAIAPVLPRPHREAKGDIIVGVLGYPNVGKSSIINALSFSQKAKVSTKAGTTHGVHWISAADNIKLIDTPGVIPLVRMEESKLGFISAKSATRLRDSEGAAGKVIEHFMKNNKLERIEKFYNFQIKPENLDNPYAILEQLSIERKHLRKGGVADEKRTAVMLVRDWQDGRLRM